MKTCTKCKEQKDLSYFFNNKNSKDLLTQNCKECLKQARKLWRTNNLEHTKEYRKKSYVLNKEREYIKSKDWRKNNPDKIKNSKAKDRLNNAIRIKNYSKNYYENNSKIILQKRKENRPALAKKQLERYYIDTNYHLAEILRNRLRTALKGNYKCGSAVKDLGCSIQHLKLHLELFWDEGMSWDNYGIGNDKWNIDHIKPLAKFDLTDREQLLEAVNYKNLQPMWHIDNIKKNDRCWGSGD